MAAGRPLTPLETSLVKTQLKDHADGVKSGDNTDPLNVNFLICRQYAILISSCESPIPCQSSVVFVTYALFTLQGSQWVQVYSGANGTNFAPDMADAAKASHFPADVVRLFKAEQDGKVHDRHVLLFANGTIQAP
jgi:hypothetical protein